MSDKSGTKPEKYQIRIKNLGHQGDGVGEIDGENCYVPFTLSGEEVEVSSDRQKWALEQIIKPSKARVEPLCRHFGYLSDQCGGCQLQHFENQAYQEWKIGLLQNQLDRTGITHRVERLESFAIDARRRVILSSVHSANGLVTGFCQRGSNRIIDIEQCPVLHPALEAALEPARAIAITVTSGIAASGVRKNGQKKTRRGKKPSRKPTPRLAMIECENGIDLHIESGAFADDSLLARIAAHDAAKNFARILLNGEVAIEFECPVIRVGKAKITPPFFTFLQAVSEAEEKMAALVSGHFEDCNKISDLFCGVGAFGLRLSEFSSLHCVESDGAALRALEAGWRGADGALKPVTTERRDLFKDPLMAKELQACDAVVFDPPRAGAEAQANQLAISGVKKIAAVSCNPKTFARDLKILVESGYEISSITAFDQFRFTPHLEAVALLERKVD